MKSLFHRFIVWAFGHREEVPYGASSPYEIDSVYAADED